MQTSILSNIGIGGTCKHISTAKTLDDLKTKAIYCIQNDIKYRVIGLGTNIYVGEIFDGTIIKNECTGIIDIDSFPLNTNNSSKCEIFVVSSGTKLMDLVYYFQKKNIDISELSHIPGTIGGAIYNNAGAYGLEISDILIGANILNNGKVELVSNEFFNFKYRSSVLKENKSNVIIISAYFKRHNKVEPGEKILENINKIITVREQKLPYCYKNIGSIFKNVLVGTHCKIPTGILLDKINAKNMKYKSLKVYEKHSNVIINNSEYEISPSEFEQFINDIKNKCFCTFGINLEVEVEKIE